MDRTADITGSVAVTAEDQTDPWLRQLMANTRNEEYVRLNYKTIVESLVVRLLAIDDQLVGHYRHYHQLLNQLMTTLDYNRRHPSPQRSLCFVDTVDRLLASAVFVTAADQLLITDALNGQNLLIKAVKCLLKDSLSDHYNNEAILRVLDRLVKSLDTCRECLAKTESNSHQGIVINHLILNTIRCLYILLNRFKFNVLSLDLNQFCGQLLGQLKCFSFYGIAGYDVSKVRQSALFPSPFAQFNDLMDNGSNERTGSVNKKNRHKKKTKNAIKSEDLDDDNDETITLHSESASAVKVMTSDSEFSSSDYESAVHDFDGQRIQRSAAIKIRLISYESLSTAVNLFDKRVIFGFWSAFIHLSTAVNLFDKRVIFGFWSAFIQSSTPGSLLWSIPREQSFRVRLSALNFLHKLLMTGNPYVTTLAADDSGTKAKPLSFTSLSQSLAHIVAEVHTGLNAILFAETNSAVLVQAFKCLSLLVTISPYKKLKNGLLVTLCDKSLPLMCHKDIQIQNSCLALAVKVFELDPFPDEMREWIVATDAGVKTMNKVLKFSCDSILSSQSILLCGESLRLLTTIMKQKPIVDSFLDRQEIHLSDQLLMNIALECLEMDVFVTNLVNQSLFCKFLFVLGTNLKRRDSPETQNQQKSWWVCVLKSRLVDLGLKCSDPSIPQSTQCVIIDFVSTISAQVFDLFDPKLKFHLISILISIVRNVDNTSTEDLNAQSAAIRCLGVYQLFPSMTEDINYLSDVATLAIEILDIFREGYHQKKLSHLLLYQTSWTLANFCDIVKKFYLRNSSEITVEFMVKLIECNVNCFDLHFANAMQSENIKTNFVRSLGSALYVVLIREQTCDHRRQTSLESDHRFRPLFTELIGKFVITLNASKNFKLQWNICIAFGYLLELDLFLQFCRSDTQLPRVSTGFGDNQTVDGCNYQLIDSILDTLVNVMQTTRNHKVQSYAVSAICAVNTSYLNDNQLIWLWTLIANFMVNHLSSVPVNIRDN
ncbi:unnamed protein product [Medioppia subpectinata]|uniref:DUF4042 domain-containing protein n=1 Tax=Medioppia subpectinata TaxID=1979941 RepID=A0A7R9PWQ9_9ACAR|nr:unnamed protein product [Medioppia subpectinata]CAG2104017.1 unnamed protein product [Medioppia subpectinata]